VNDARRPRHGLLMQRPRKPPQRPPQPGKGRGRLQIAARRAFLLADVVSTSVVADAAYCRHPKWRDDCRRVVGRPSCAGLFTVGRTPALA